MLASYGMESTYPDKANSRKEVAAFMHELESQIETIQINHYFRAGRTYLTVKHTMGKPGNLFFKSVFEKLLKGCKEKPHITSDEKSICIIFRI